jgi:GTPase SAR1 family protein
MSSRDSQPFGKNRTITVTMLGKSGCGKTVFLWSLYSQLAEGSLGFTAAPTNDLTDLVLGGGIEDLYLKNEAPEGTKENELLYGFSLMYKGETVAEIDCFDYRGGAIADDAGKTESGKILQQRIARSDIVMWLVDLAEVKDAVPEGLFSRRARLLTNLRRLQSICSQAIKIAPKLRVWSFVRTKVDKDFPNLTETDLKKATEELHEHLRDVVAIATFSNESYANLVSIAPIGKAIIEDDKIVAGNEAINVEWPLLTSIAMLLQDRLAALDEQVELAEITDDDHDGGSGLFSRRRREKSVHAPSDAILEAEKEREFLTAILTTINENVPTSVLRLSGGGDTIAESTNV